MFKLDIYVFNFLYTQCKCLGSLVGQGVLEGFLMYLGIIISAILKAGKEKKWL